MPSEEEYYICMWCQQVYDPEKSDAYDTEEFCSDDCENKSAIAERYDDYDDY